MLLCRASAPNSDPAPPCNSDHLLKQDMEPSTSSAQSLLKDRYLIEKELGRGGIGVVYLARDQQLHGKPVVIKVLLPSVEESTNSQWFRKKFQQEIEALARIEHPGVVGVLDSGATDDGRSFLVMQYIEGRNLRSIIQPQGIALERTAQIIRQIGQALSAAHDKGVMHCDLKPENIMLQSTGDEEEHVKLIDFGVAKIKNSRFARTGEATKVAGTVWYMAPEQMQGVPGFSSDVYAMGAIAYELLTGRPPFTPESPFQLLEMQRAGVSVKPSALRPSLPAVADQAILRALAPDPQQRYARAKEFGDELARTLTDQQNFTIPQTTQISPATVVESPARLTQAATKKNAWLPVLIGAGLILFAVAGWLVFSRSDPAAVKTADLPAQPITALPTRSLRYSVLVQKTRDGRPYQEPFRLAKEINFEAGYTVRLLFIAEQPGYLYIINEGPQRANGLPQYNLLFPAESTQGGNAEVAANQEVQIPAQSWFVFDQEEGTEKVWLVWAEKSVPALAAIGPAGPQNRGIVSGEQIPALKNLLTGVTQTPTTQDEDYKQTIIRGSGEMFVHLLKLEHH